MKEGALEGLEVRLGVLTMCLLPLHLYVSILNLAYTADCGGGFDYPVRSYVLSLLELGVFLAGDLFLVKNRRFLLSKELCRYWGVCCVMSLLMVLLSQCHSEAAGLLLIPALVTPYFQLLPLLRWLGVSISVLPLSGIAAVGLLSALQWGLFRYFSRQASA